MARPKRLKLKDEEGFFHIMSRTGGQEFYLGDVEKEKLFNIIKYYSGFYFVKVIGLTVMSNHFHLLIKSEPESYYSDDQVKQRIEKYLDKNKDKKKRKKKKDKEEEGEEVEEGEEEISYNKLQQIKNQMADIEAGKDAANVKSTIDDETYRHELMRDFKLPTGEIMLGRIRHFSQGMVIGSKQFLIEAYAKFGGEIIGKKDRNVYQTGINGNILSLRKLIC
jgi:REP element-mobilizing transposase RayT